MESKNPGVYPRYPRPFPGAGGAVEAIDWYIIYLSAITVKPLFGDVDRRPFDAFVII